MQHFLMLKLEVVAGLPVGLTFFVFLGVKSVQLLVDGLNLGLNFIRLCPSRILLDVSLLKLLPDVLHLFV